MLKQKFLDLKKSTFFLDVFHSFVSRGIYIGLGFLSTWLIARYFTVEAYGEYAFMLSIALTCFQLTHLGFSSSNTFYIVNNKRYLPFLIANTRAHSLIVGLISLLLLLFLNEIYFHKDVVLILITAFIVPFEVMSLLNKGLLIGVNKIQKSNVLELLSRFVYAVIVVFLVAYYRSIVLLLIAYLIQMMIMSLTSFFSLKKNLKDKLTTSFKLFKKASNYSIRIYIILFLSFLVLRIDVYFIEHLLGDKELGVYSLAVMLASNLILIIQVVIPLLVPKLSSIKNQLERYNKLTNIVLYSLVLLVFINIVFMLFGEGLIIFVFGDKYADSVLVFKILLLASSLLSIESIIAQYYATIGKLKFLIYYWVGALFLNILLNYLWIPQYGIKGAAWASLLSYGFILLLLLEKLIREIYFIKKKNEKIV